MLIGSELLVVSISPLVPGNGVYLTSLYHLKYLSKDRLSGKICTFVHVTCSLWLLSKDNQVRWFFNYLTFFTGQQ